MKSLKILFCGTAQFAVPTLEYLIENKWDLVGAVTQPDRRQGRGRKIAPPAVKEFLAGSLPVYQPATTQELIEIINKYNIKPDVIVVVAYGMLLPLEILNLPPLGCINLHPSLLPKYRGAAPIQRVIMNGEQMTGITTMYLSPEMDAGDIILQEEAEIPVGATAGELGACFAERGAVLMEKTLSMLRQGTAPRHPQEHHLATYAPPLRKEEAQIDWSRTAKEIVNQINGMNPKPGAYTVLEEGKTLKLWQGSINDKISSYVPGEVVECDPKTGFIVQTGCGQILLTEVQPAGRKRMSGSEFVRGYNIAAGLRLG
jgi:methionyl-tRNA formyltransferase